MPYRVWISALANAKVKSTFAMRVAELKLRRVAAVNNKWGNLERRR